MIAGLLRDVTWAWRLARADRAVTAVVTLTLAVGIGATLTVFSIVDAWLLRPLSFPNAGAAIDLLSFISAAGVVLAVIVAAAVIPSYRATRINSTDVLRAE